MTVNPLKDSELIFYGGEYYNGDKVSTQSNGIFFVIIEWCSNFCSMWICCSAWKVFATYWKFSSSDFCLWWFVQVQRWKEWLEAGVKSQQSTPSQCPPSCCLEKLSLYFWYADYWPLLTVQVASKRFSFYILMDEASNFLERLYYLDVLKSIDKEIHSPLLDALSLSVCLTWSFTVCLQAENTPL